MSSHKADRLVPSNQLGACRHGSQDNVPPQIADTKNRTFFSQIKISNDWELKKPDWELLNYCLFTIAVLDYETDFSLGANVPFKYGSSDHTLIFQRLAEDR